MRAAKKVHCSTMGKLVIVNIHDRYRGGGGVVHNTDTFPLMTSIEIVR